MQKVFSPFYDILFISSHSFSYLFIFISSSASSSSLNLDFKDFLSEALMKLSIKLTIKRTRCSDSNDKLSLNQ